MFSLAKSNVLTREPAFGVTLAAGRGIRTIPISVHGVPWIGAGRTGAADAADALVPGTITMAAAASPIAIIVRSLIWTRHSVSSVERAGAGRGIREIAVHKCRASATDEV